MYSFVRHVFDGKTGLLFIYLNPGIKLLQESLIIHMVGPLNYTFTRNSRRFNLNTLAAWSGGVVSACAGDVESNPGRV
jgi:hypothetical protein